MKLAAYLRLMRFHKPVGILLLWYPTAWALTLTGANASLWAIFLIGTILMRAAGCVINDLADRNIDPHITRTAKRPLAAKEISLNAALLLVLLLLVSACILLILLPKTCFYCALFAIIIVISYPFCKRFLQAPQLVLGIAFSIGIPMAYFATNTPWNMQISCLFLINFLWIVAYDTMYAMVDREDDLQIGVQSTAILFAEYDRLIILGLQVAFHGLWLYLAILQNYTWPFYACWVLAGCALIYQQYLIRERNQAACLRAFTNNTWYGLIMWMGLLASVL